MEFTPLAALPGWEATEGAFRMCGCGRLRFVRYLRRTGDCLAYAVVADTPRQFDLFVEASAARFAERTLDAAITAAEAA